MGIARIAWPMSDAWFSSCEARASRSRNGSNRVTIPTTSRETVGAGPGGPAPSRGWAEGDGHANLRDAPVLALAGLECQGLSAAQFGRHFDLWRWTTWAGRATSWRRPARRT